MTFKRPERTPPGSPCPTLEGHSWPLDSRGYLAYTDSCSIFRDPLLSVTLTASRLLEALGGSDGGPEEEERPARAPHVVTARALAFAQRFLSLSLSQTRIPRPRRIPPASVRTEYTPILPRSCLDGV
ncbi:hypothetical protein AAFF_G00214120 [Aldrovandia affinis]|uniref:Uncharacterized protein n=1 Tax=Aldrovandia affinis TaxID=143900 RepID=A0AAD7RH67_9TELE|nr:hypothetical protein AAFF_G00214120 [Aldrovandia affinis]